MTVGGAGSEPYRAANLLDGISSPATRAHHDRHLLARECELVARRLGLPGGDVVSIGCGWNPGRHLFPAPAFRLVGIDADPAKVAGVLSSGRVDEARVGVAGALDLRDQSFDVVLYRLVLHHIVYQGPLAPCFAEGARLLKPGGSLIAIEPGLWHPVGAALALANKLGVATALHGTPDDVPLSPRVLESHAGRVGLRPELHALTYTWRRMPPSTQRLVARLDPIGSRPRAASVGHTLMLIARKPQAPLAGPLSHALELDPQRVADGAQRLDVSRRPS